MKVNCDRAFTKNGNKEKEKCVGNRIVIRNEEGLVIAGTSRRINVKSCLETEAGALREVWSLQRDVVLRRLYWKQIQKLCTEK